MSDTAVGVIIPARNPDIALWSAINSARSAFPRAEVVVIDDGSDPPVAEILGSQATAHTVLRLAESVGPAAARNAGAALSQEAILLFLDADDLLLPGITLLAHELERSGSRIAFGGVEVVRGGAAATLRLPSPHPFLNCESGISHLAGAFLIERSLFEEVGGYDPALHFSENTDLVVRAVAHELSAGRGIVSIPTPVVRYHAPTSEAKYDARRLEAVEYLLKRGRPDLEHAEARAGLLAIGAVNAARLSMYRVARRHALASFRARPSLKSATRLAIVCAGPLGKFWWQRQRREP